MFAASRRARLGAAGITPAIAPVVAAAVAVVAVLATPAHAGAGDATVIRNGGAVTVTAATRASATTVGTAAAAAAAAATVTPTAVPGELIVSLSVSPPLFSPKAVGAPRAARVIFRLSASARVHAIVVDRQGRRVRTLMASAVRPAAWFRLSWKGDDGAGRRAADGRYRVKVVAHRKGVTTVRMRAVALDATPPQLTRLWSGPNPFWPDGDGVADKLSIAVWMTGEHARVVTTIRGAGISQTYSGDVSGTARYTFGGRVGSGVTYGRAVIRATARDAAGNEKRLTRGVLVSPYSDIGSAGGAICSSLLTAKRRGWATARGGLFSGDSSSRFRPMEGAARRDLAAVLARAFGGSSTVPERDFSDIPSATALSRYASLVVARGWMSDYRAPDGSRQFRPGLAARTADVARGLTRALGLGMIAARVRTQDPGAPWYAGDTVVMQDLGLRRRGARVHPLSAYPRGELASSVVAAKAVPSYRVDYVMRTFPASKVLVQSKRQRDFTLTARRWLGEPYVWGGESLAEGGFDCSGLIWATARSRGLYLARTAAAQSADRRFAAIGLGRLHPGDGIYFASPSERVFHAGMYLGDGYFIHSTGSRNGVTIDSLRTNDWWRSRFKLGRRFIPMVRITGVAVEPVRFSPNGDGRKDTLGVRFTTTKEATVCVHVDGASGARARTFLFGRRPATVFALSWDGRSGSARAPDARYCVRIRAVDEEGNKPIVERWVTLDTSAPALLSPGVTPNPYDPDDGVATVSVWVGEAARVRVDIEDSKGSRVFCAWRTAAKPMRLRVSWTGRDSSGKVVPSGTYRYRFVATDGASNTRYMGRRAFTVR